jgi:Fe-S oxidoreductase
MMREENNTSVDVCNLCGICNLACPVYAVTLNETASPRFKAFLAKKKERSEAFFLCTECSSCFAGCPVDVRLNIAQLRQAVLKSGKEHPANKLMRDNIVMHGNPFGEKPDKKIKHYYT